LFTSPIKSSEILLAKLAGLEIYNTIFLILCFTISIIFIGFKNNISVSGIVKVHLILLVYLYACGALGILCSTICKNCLYAAEMAYTILAILISDVVLIRPFIRWGFKASSTISLALHANPFTPICAVLELDIFRTQSGINLYNLSPVASYGYSFPAWYLIGLWYVLGLVGCLAMGSFVIKRRRRIYNG
jgi:ABC-type transport system involved in multi-copper enzyme maturation permease subunit